jgi:hypothetical protein
MLNPKLICNALEYNGLLKNVGIILILGFQKWHGVMAINKSKKT